MKYIFVPYQKALEAGLINSFTEERRVNNDHTKILLHEGDFSSYKPMITVDVDGNRVEKYADTLEEKVRTVEGVIMDQKEAIKEITKPEWQKGVE